MPKRSDAKIRAAKPREKPYKLFDADGLFLIVHPNGGRWWRQRYYLAGKEQLLIGYGRKPRATRQDGKIVVQGKEAVGINGHGNHYIAHRLIVADEGRAIGHTGDNRYLLSLRQIRQRQRQTHRISRHQDIETAGVDQLIE